MTNLLSFLSLRFSKTNLELEEFLSQSLTLMEFQLEDTEPRLLIPLTISGDRELSDIKTPIYHRDLANTYLYIVINIH